MVLYRNSACRPRRVDAELDPGGWGKELVEEGLDTVPARRATVRARLVIVCSTLATVRFKKRNPSKEICENLKVLLKNRRDFNFKRKPLQKFVKISKFCSKK